MATPLKVRIKLTDPAKLRAISSGEIQKGMFFIAAPQRVAPGSPIEITLVMPDNATTAALTGVVQPTDRAGILVRVNNPAAVVQTIEAFLRTTDYFASSRSRSQWLLGASEMGRPTDTEGEPHLLTERRESARVEARVKIRLKFANASQFEETYTKEVSLGGLFVATAKPVPVGTTVEVIFLVGPETFSLAGTVAHHHPRAGTPGMGIRLAEVPAHVKTRFEALVRSAASSTPGQDQRRNSPRVATRAAIKLRPTTTRRFDEMCLKDISRGGTFVAVTKCYPVGTPLTVVLVHPTTAKEVRITGRVVRDVSVEEARVTGTEAGMGIQFDPLAPEARATIDELIASAVGVDRRTAPRIESRTRVMLSFGDADELRELYTKDISKGGAFIVTDDPPPVMTQIEVTVVPPGAAGISLLADVVHSVPKSAVTNPNDTPGMGVRFRNLTPEKRAILENYLAALADKTPARPSRDARPLSSLKPLAPAGQSSAASEVTGNKSPQQQRAEEFFALAQECLARGDREAALRNIQLATTFDPAEERFRALLKEIRNR